MAGPLIETKLAAPRLRRGTVARGRLLARLRRASDARLTLVAAPAGFGKTTLLAEWLAEPAGEDPRVAWLSLDAADREPSTFWTYVLAALGRALVDEGGLDLHPSSPALSERDLTALVNELAGVRSEVWLVLDDFHLADGPEIGDGMSFLLEHLPPQVHVVIGTRADPGLPLARLRARGELVEIRAADLRFTTDEATAYFDAAGLTLGAGDVDALEERTEGWIAALQLAAVSLEGREDVSGFVRRFAGDDRYVVDYLLEEVLEHVTPEVREFLLRTSILDRLTGPLCDAVTLRDDGSELLAALERANLFLVALDERREWYRYHHLFADALRARLLSDRPDELAGLQVRASEWFERHDLLEEAIRHALAAADVDRAGRLIELALPGLRRDRRDATLFGWLTALPDEVVRRSPVLSAFAAHLLMASGDLDGAGARLDDAERALTAGAGARDGGEELRTLPATIAVFRAALAQARGDATGTAEHARHALTLAGPDDHLSRGSAAGMLGLAAWTAGDVTAALETFTQAVASLRAAGNRIDELSSTIVLADMWRTAGRPSRARQLTQRALQRAEPLGAQAAGAAAALHEALAELDVERGDFEPARQHLDAAATLTASAGPTESSYRWFVASAALAVAESDPATALDALDRAEELWRPGYFPDLRPIPAVRARIRIAQGDLLDAADWAHTRGVSPADESDFLHEFDHLTLVRLLLAQHRTGQDGDPVGRAAALLDRLQGAADSGGRAGSLLEIRMLAALARDARGDRAGAVAALNDALALAPETDGRVRLFLDEGAPMIGLLRDAVRRDGPHEHVRALLDSLPASAGEQAASAPSAPGPLSDRELQVLRLLETELTGPEIARTLFVSQNTLRTHTKHIFTKLDVTSRRAAVLRARTLGLL